MDPSYNNPHYYPPTQQSYPTQQGYPPVNPYQYDQHPQNSYPVPNTNNSLNELDQGCFKVYKIALIVEVVWKLWNLATLIRLLLYIGAFYPSSFLSIILYFAQMALVYIQLSAMKNKDLKKAKMALIGFISYIFICMAMRILSFLQLDRGINLQFLLMGFIWISLDAILTVIGSFKVYQFLNVNQIKSESDNYQNYYRA